MKKCKISYETLLRTDDIANQMSIYLSYEGFDVKKHIDVKSAGDCSTFIQEGDYTCEYCGKTDESVFIYRIYGELFPHLQEHPLNCVPMCSDCINKLTPDNFMDWMDFKFKGRLCKLRVLAYSKGKIR